MDSDNKNNKVPKDDWAARTEEILKKQGRSKRWLASGIHIDYTQLNHILSGNRNYNAARPGTTEHRDLVKQICNLLQLPEFVLLDDEVLMAEVS